MAAPPPPRPCSTTAAVRAGWRSTPRPARSTGPTWTRGEIRVANLDGTGTASTLFAAAGTTLCGVAVDPAASKIYWANFSTNEIRVANLDGTGAAATLFTDPAGSAPSGVAIDPADNKIYWTNQFSDEVRAGNLDGSGTAADPVWRRGQPDRGRGRPGGRQDLLDRPRLRHGPGRAPGGQHASGTATDPVQQPGAERAGDRPNGEQDLLGKLDVRLGIRVGNLEAAPGTASTLFGGESRPLFAALLKAPAEHASARRSPAEPRSGGSSPAKTGRGRPTCSASFLFRAPASFAYQWKRNGSNIATGPDVHAQPDRRLHLHRDGHQPGRVDLADESQEEGQGRVGQWS